MILAIKEAHRTLSFSWGVDTYIAQVYLSGFISKISDLASKKILIPLSSVRWPG